MRKAASKLRWRGRGVLVALTLAVGVLGLLLLGSSVRADEPPYPTYASTDVSETDCLANADILSEFGVENDPWPCAMYDAQVSFTPVEWGVPESADVPIGAVVGKLEPNATLGWFNGPCNSPLGPPTLIFDPLMNCSIDTSDTVSFDGQFDDTNGNMIQDGCDKYPDFLNTMFPGLTPRTRHASFEIVSGVTLSLNFLTFEPGTSLPLPGVPAFGPDLGYVAMSVLNDPTAPMVKNQITDNCPPLSTETTYYGVSRDNNYTAGVDESGYAWRTNPQYAGTYTFNGYTHSFRDADNDDIDNELDPCPYDDDTGWDPAAACTGSPPTTPGDTDCDGLPDSCDPASTTKKTDEDGDGFPNRQDNCPLDDNEGQEDGDYDSIGDACDLNDSTPDGDKATVWFASDIEISGESCLVLGADTDGDGFEDAEELNLGSCYADPCDEEEFCSGTEAVDSTPEDVSVGGTCTDEEDNDSDGYIDDVDGGCGDDTDGDGVSDDGEDDLGSDFEDANSTPEHASVCDVCTDGVDNDGDGDIDAADEGCAEAEVTPTPTPEEGTPTPTPEEATPTPTAAVEICEPVFPGTYNGFVRIDGQPAADGYEVTASIDGMEWGSDIVSGGRYAMDIPDYLPSEPPCFEGGTITFALNGMTCTPTADWASGIQTVDLDCAPEVTPQVTPEVTPQVTPEVTPQVTPTAPPPSGAGGLSGSGPGLPLWAMALASWAGLTIVAGLGTLVAAKRR